MMVSLVNTDTNNPSRYDGEFQVRTVDKSGFYLYQQDMGVARGLIDVIG
jgi:hypothetical protein